MSEIWGRTNKNYFSFRFINFNNIFKVEQLFNLKMTFFLFHSFFFQYYDFSDH